MKKIFFLTMAAMMFLSTVVAMATPTTGSGSDDGQWVDTPFTVTWGDYDPALEGQVFDWHDYNATGDWIFGDHGFSLDISVVPTSIISADFSVILGGAGYLQPATVSLNGYLLGDASVGDGYLGANVYRVDSFPLSSGAISSLGAINTLGIDTSWGDGYAFVGAELAGIARTWQTGGGSGGGSGTAPVPEPATMLLFGTGLAALAGVQARRKK